MLVMKQFLMIKLFAANVLYKSISAVVSVELVVDVVSVAMIKKLEVRNILFVINAIKIVLVLYVVNVL